MKEAIKPNWKGRLVSSVLTGAGLLIKWIYNGNIPIGGLQINVTRAPVSAKIVFFLFTNTYELSERLAIKRYLDPHLTVVELGASIGVVTCVLRQTLHSSIRLISIEANPQLIEQVQYNVQHNKLGTGVYLNNYAIAYNKEMAKLQLSTQTTGARVQDNLSSSENLVEVPAITLSGLLKTYDVGDFTLVSDIEGSEYDILYKDQAAFERCRQIIIELHNTAEASIDELSNYIVEALGYELQFRNGNVFVFTR
jgi:FkbM family methyltransferase